jgi:hypothetical protein
MAYREFHNEKYYEAPDVGIVERGLARMNDTIADQIRAASEAKKAKALAADQFKFDLGQGKFENDDKIFFARGQNITARTRDELKRTGAVSPQIQKDQQQALVDKNSSDWQYKAMTDMVGQIDAKSKEDIYYDPEHDKNLVKEAAYGKDNDVYYATRGDRLTTASNQLFRNPTSLRGKVYTADYVKTFGKKENLKVSENPNMKSSNYMSTPFLTPAGIPGVTIDHAKQYLSSRPDGSVARWVENYVEQDMLDEVKYTKEKNSNIKGMTDDEAVLYLKAHPEENASNKTPFADRVITRAQKELMEAADINQKIDYETKIDKTITNGLYSNDYIGQSDTNHEDDFGEESASPGLFAARSFAGPKNSMPGGTLRIAKGAKVGQAIPVDMNPQYMVNMRNGKLIENKGSMQFNITGYQSAAYDNVGRPKVLNKEAIKYLRPSDFKNLAPELGVAVRGYTLNQGNKLGELASRQSELDDKLAKAVQDNDIDAQEAINDQIGKLKELRDMLNLSPTEVSDEDLMSAYKQNGINVSNIKQDMLVKPSQQDISLIDKTLTRGLDITNPNKQSAEMREVNELYKKKYREAAAKGFKDDSETKAKLPEKKVKVIAPDGRVGSLPESQVNEALQAGYKRAQ